MPRRKKPRRLPQDYGDQADAKLQLALIRLVRAGLLNARNMAILMMYAENGADMNRIIEDLKEDLPDG